MLTQQPVNIFGISKRTFTEFLLSEKIIIPFIIILGFILRVIDLGSESLSFDEIYSVRLAQMNFAGIINVTAYDYHPPLYYFLLHLWVLFSGVGETGVRMLSVLFNTAAIWMTFKTGKILFDKHTGILAALLFAVSHFNVEFSQEARMYSLLALLSISSMYFLLSYLKYAQKSSLFYLVLVNILLLHTHVYSFFVVAAELIYFFSLAKTDKNNFKLRLKNFLLAQLFIFLAFLPWATVFLRQFLNAQQNLWIPKAGSLVLVESIIEYSGSLLLAVLMIPLAFFSIVSTEWTLKINPPGQFRRSLDLTISNTKEAIFLLTWLSVPILLPFIISQFLSPIFLVKYTIGVCAAFIIFVAKGLINVHVTPARITLITIILLLSFFNVFADMNVKTKEKWREAVEFIDSGAQKDDLVIFNTAACIDLFNYYSNRKDLSKLPLTLNNDQLNQDSIKAIVMPLLENNKRIWLLVSHSTDGKGLLVSELKNLTNFSSLQQFSSNYRRYFFIRKYDSNEFDFYLMKVYYSPDISVYFFKKNN
ncbi:MAG: glycosyltransferase family 39 protein [Methanococcaceae archaeon]